MSPRQGQRADRQVHEEHPPPAGVLHEDAAQQRTDDRRDGEGGGDVPLVAPALARGDEVADRRHGEGHEPAGGGALHGAQERQLRDVLGGAAQRRGGDEDGERDLEQAAVAVAVAELAPERRGRGGRDDVGRNHPREVGQAAEVGGDHRQGGGEDGLVEHGGQHREHDRGERDPDRRRPGFECGRLGHDS